MTCNRNFWLKSTLRIPFMRIISKHLSIIGLLKIFYHAVLGPLHVIGEYIGIDGPCCYLLSQRLTMPGPHNHDECNSIVYRPVRVTHRRRHFIIYKQWNIAHRDWQKSIQAHIHKLTNWERQAELQQTAASVDVLWQAGSANQRSCILLSTQYDSQQ